MIIRELVAGRINALLNSPEIRPSVAAGKDDLDVSNLMLDPSTIVLMDRAGTAGMIFAQHEPGVYEVHTQIAPGARGAEGVRWVRAALTWIFTHTDAMELITQVPENNLPALGLVRAIRGRKEYTRAASWETADGTLVSSAFYALRYPDWLLHSDELVPAGEAFHAELDELCAEAGVEHEPHADDPGHNRAVGAAVLTIRGGQPAKAVTLYNRWARMARYGLIEVVRTKPLIINILTCLVVVGDDGVMAVLPTQKSPQAAPVPPQASQAA